MSITSGRRVDRSGSTAIPQRTGALIVVAAAAAALGCGQLVAGLLAPASSPFQAVADTVVRLAPPALIELGKGLRFPMLGLGPGEADKVALLLGIAVTVLVICVLAGIASSRSPQPGRVVMTLLGLTGLAAVVSGPVFEISDVIAPITAAFVGLAVFEMLYPRTTTSASSFADPGRGVSRRRVLRGVGAAGLLGIGAGLLGISLGDAPQRSRTALRGLITPTHRAPPLPAGADFAGLGTPRFVTANREFYRIDTALRVPQLTTTDWSLRVHGMIARPLRLTYDELLSRPLLEKTITMTCVSNEVNGPLISTANFAGISLRDLLLETGVNPAADQLFSTSVDGWTAGTPTDVVLREDTGALLAIAMNGEPLPPEHGFPVRMVVPGLYGFVSATKWVTDLELTTFEAKHAYWRQRGWSRLAPIKTQSRIDRPRPFATLALSPAGTVTVAGLAWAQTRGIAKVEVRLDQRGPWLPAILSTEVNNQTWRMWRINLTASPGLHSVESRATDSTGTTQTSEQAAPIPNGATGWPSIAFTVIPPTPS